MRGQTGDLGGEPPKDGFAFIIRARDLTNLESPGERSAPHAVSTPIIPTQMGSRAAAKVIVTATSAVHAIIDTGGLRAGSAACHVAGPRDASAMVTPARDDILVVDGGMVNVPGPVDLHFKFGFPPGKEHASMA